MAIFSTIGYWSAYAVGFLGAGAGLSVSTAVTLATIAGQAAISVALTAVARVLSPRPNVSLPDVQALLSQADAPRRVYVGRALAGGIRALFETKDGILYQLVVVNHGLIDAFETFWIDGEPQVLSTSPDWWGIPQPVQFPTGTEKEGYVNVVTRNGSGQGGDYPVLSQIADWNASRRLDGQATFLVGSKAPGANDFMSVFPKAHQTVFQWVIRGARVLDTRNGQTVWSDNAALVIAHYLRHPDGFRLAASELNADSVSAMANVADIAVPQQGGGTAPSLRLWGYWTLDEEPGAVLDRMAAASGISAYEMQNGQIGLIGGPYGTPACTLTAKDIREIQTSAAISEREGYNVLQLHHLSPTHNYEMVELDPWRDEDRLAIEGEIPREMRLEMCPSRSQARRRGKQQIHDDNRARVTVITNLVGLKARFPRFNGQRHTILLDYRPADGSGRVIAGEYEVLDHQFDPVRLECRIVLATVDRACQAWTPAEEGTVSEPASVSGGDLPPPLVATLTQRAFGAVPVLVVQAADQGREDLSVQARFRRVGDVAWQDMATTALVANSGVVEDAQDYQVQARWRGVFRGVAPWQSLGTISVRVDSTPPAAPTQLSLIPGGLGITVRWRNPSSHFAQARVYRGTSTDFSAASLLGATGGAAGQLSELVDASAISGTTYRYWVTAINASGVEGPPAGPKTITA